MKNRFLIRAMYAAAVALFFTACGSDNDGGGSSPAKEPNVNRNTDYSDAAATRIEVPKSGKTKCARFEKRNVQKSGKTKRSKNFAHTTL